VIVLGIETSCDETAAAIVCDGRQVLSNVVRSQIELHRPYGGVVPEIASRRHVEVLPDVLERAIRDADIGWQDLGAIAVTYGPGLASSLIVGVAAAKALSLRLALPLAAVNHLQAHIYSVFLSLRAPAIESICPFLALVVSGGHTCLVRVDRPGRYTLLGETVDDAAGEAFDKGANLLGLGYPGGPAVDRIGKDGNPSFFDFPRSVVKKQRGLSLDPQLCFSYSGLKTSLLYYLKSNPLAEGDDQFTSIVASYQEAIVDSIVSRCDAAMSGMSTLAVGGGVALNSRLRERLRDWAKSGGYELLVSEPCYCADNAAMIAGLASSGEGIWGEEALGIDVTPSLSVCT
jgi:N6-L-threonylcarbamoyladenine synthase